MIIGKRNFDTDNHCYVMGILNITPDSFSDGGNYNDMDRALFHTRQMIEEGADIIDVGGESTRPGYTRVSDDEEISRIVPVIEQIKDRFDIPVSVDTYKSRVADAAIRAGADLINDIWGFKYDKAMAGLVAGSGVACCLVHNRKEASYDDFMRDFMKDMTECIDLAKAAGVADDRIILDPGVGFAKSYQMNLEVINKLEEMQRLGYPVLLGTSRKSVIGLTLDLPSDQRMEGTLATNLVGLLKGAAFVRVHDVKENVRAIKMAEAVLKAGIDRK